MLKRAGLQGDLPVAAEGVLAVRDALLAEGFTLCTLPEVVSA